MKPITQEDIARLRRAIKQREHSDKIIKSILDRHPFKNKTTALYTLLGLCPQCGGKKDVEGRYYCSNCRKRATGWSVARYDRKKYPQPKASPQFEQYDNDDH